MFKRYLFRHYPSILYIFHLLLHLYSHVMPSLSSINKTSLSFTLPRLKKGKKTHIKAFYVLLILSTGTELFSDVDDNFWNILKNAGVKEFF